MTFSKVKIAINVPLEYTEKVRDALFEIGAGKIGNYNCCSVITKCSGTFKPNENATPFIGEKNVFKTVEEEKIEVICPVSIVKRLLTKIREVHPYEEPVIMITPLIEEEYFK